jgi:Fe(3+) dicitrate transport protein
MSRILISVLLLCAARAQAADGGEPFDGGAPTDGASDAAPAPDAAPASPAPAPAPAPPPPRAPPPDHAWVTPRVDVIGRGTRALQHIPGTASVIKREDLRQLAPQNAGEALRTQPGVNVIGESDGMGLRLNVGIRGLDPNRSRKILVLEDGMPVALNPYGAPELYYSPAIERMDHIEVVKGSGSILWGPQTIGGVINYITRDPPRRLALNADLRYGSFNYLLAQAGIGATHGQVGWRLDVIHRRFDGPRRLDLALTDVSGKLRLQLTPRSTLGIKLNFYDEFSRSTYLGPTSLQFEDNPATSLAQHDQFVLRRYAVGVTHQHLFSDNLLLQTTAYGYETHRAWRRQEFERQDNGGEYERICDSIGRCGPRGATDVAPDPLGGSIFFRNSSAIRNRTFWVAGVEPRLTWKWALPRVLTGELTGLVRFHYERARTQILITDFPTAQGGDLHDDEIRNGYALAAAVQNRFTLWNRLHITPGIRFENFWSDRQIIRVPNTLPDGTRRGRDVDVFGSTFSYAVIPGLGIAADVVGPLTLFAGVHRGYAPPRTQDAVSAGGQNLELDPELSWNSEIGLRLRLSQVLSVDLAAFHLEFENQIIPPSEAGGAVSGNMFNSGHSRHTGLEAAVLFDFVPLLSKDRARWSMPLTVNYTYLPLAAFVGGIWGGNRLPYAPEHLLYAQLRFVHEVGFSAQVGVTYVSSQFADKENTPSASRDGLVGAVPGYALLDARIAYTIARAGLTLYVSGKNLTNQVYVASRAPQGIQPAGFLQVFGGVEWTWQKSR